MRRLVTDPEHDTAIFPAHLSRLLLARAHSCLAHAYFVLHSHAHRGEAVKNDFMLPIYRPLPERTPDRALANDLYLLALYTNAAVEQDP